MHNILFVCLGNICRSPAAQAIMQHIVDDAGLSDSYVIDSAGTIGFHEGDTADPRMIAYAAARGYRLTHRARKLRPTDFDAFDLILTMDDANYDTVRDRAPSPEAQQKVRRLTDFCINKVVDAVPDPYYGGSSGFVNVIDILEDACRGLLNALERR